MANTNETEHFKTDVLIIGAGLRAAIEAAKAEVSVLIASRAPVGRGGLTATANGGYHAAMWPGDSPVIHAEDMIDAGSNLNDRNLVRTLTEESPARGKYLGEIGASPYKRKIQVGLGALFCMGDYAYIERDKQGLSKALEELDKLEADLTDLSAGEVQQYNLNLCAALDVRSLVKTGKVVCMAALNREETRGFHYRSDFPAEKEKAEHTAIWIENGSLKAGTRPVQMS
jgi:succinate dehydrogenase/fumarate reductase flavoprotein subunit